MSTGQRISLIEGRRLAVEIVQLLRGACERIEVAGSLRRNSPDVGDIELVAIPKVIAGGTDLFGDPTEPTDLLHDLALDLIGKGTFEPRLASDGKQAIGKRYKRLLFKGFPLDLFAVNPPAQWGVIFTIRTGPADFSKRLVTGVEFGGHMPARRRVQEGALWESRGPFDSNPHPIMVPTPEEKDFFAALGLNWIEPEARR